MESWPDIIKAIPTELWGTVLLLALLYKVLDWWRRDVQRMEESVNRLTNTIERMSTIVELTQYREQQRRALQDDLK